MPSKAEAKAEPVFRVGPEACLKGGRVAGEYLDSIGKGEVFDRLTKEEWTTFVVKVVGGALLASIGDFHDDQIPF